MCIYVVDTAVHAAVGSDSVVTGGSIIMMMLLLMTVIPIMTHR